MIFLDELVAYDENSATCKVTITENSQFFNEQEQAVPIYVGIEYMAQCIAAYANANGIDNGKSVSVGFLVSSRKFETSASEYPLGAELVVIVNKVIENENGLSVFDCEIKSSNNILAKASINVFQPADPDAFLEEQLTSE